MEGGFILVGFCDWVTISEKTTWTRDREEGVAVQGLGREVCGKWDVCGGSYRSGKVADIASEENKSVFGCASEATKMSDTVTGGI